MKIIPNWIINYKKSDLKSDLIAGITIGIILIPQGMAYAMLAGLPPQYGLYAALTPPLIYALLGTSRQLSVGPVALDSLLVASIVGGIAQQGTKSYISLAIFLALLMGFFQFLFGLLKLGFLVNFISRPVIIGFISAAAIIIALSQFKYLLGLNFMSSNNAYDAIYQTYFHLEHLNVYSFFIGFGSITLLVLFNKIDKKVPMTLVLVLLLTLLVWYFQLDKMGVAIIGAIPAGLPKFHFAVISLDKLKLLTPSAITIAFIAFMESVSVAKAIQQKKQSNELKPNKELMALGLANVIGSFFSSYVVTGGFSRTAVNNEIGAKSQLSTVFGVIIIFLTLLFFTPLFYYLPKSLLGAVVIVSVIKLINFNETLLLFKKSKIEFILLILTFLSTLFIGSVYGILIGIMLSIGFLIYKNSKPHYAILGKVKNENVFRNIERFDNAETNPEILIIRFDEKIFFGNAQYFFDIVHDETCKRKEQIKLLILDFKSVSSIDYSGIKTLEMLVSNLKKSNINVNLTSLIGPVRDEFEKYGIFEIVGEKNIQINTLKAVNVYENNVSEQDISTI